MYQWRELQQERREYANESAFIRAENEYLTPPEDPEDDDIEIEEEDIEEEKQIRRFEREKEER